MAVSFSVPASPRRSILTIDEFLGADFTNSPASADINKSPNCINMIRDVPGKVRKCMGYETVEEYDEASYLKFKMFNKTYTMNDMEPPSGLPSYIQVVITGQDLYNPNLFGIKYSFWNIVPGSETFHREYKLDEDMYLPLQSELEDIYNSDEWSEQYGSFRRIKSAYIEMEETVSSPYLTGLEFDIYLNDGIYELWYLIRFEQPEEGSIDEYQSRFMISCFNAKKDISDDNKVNGFHKLRTDDEGLLHVGTYMIHDGTILYDNANDARSKSWEFDEHLYILDGKQLLKFGYTEPTSDTKFSEDKSTNLVVKDDEVTLILKRYPKKGYSLKITSSTTNSPNGKFAVSKDKRTITYTDKLSTVGQYITYSCQWKYKKTSSSSATNGSISNHHLRCISDEKYFSVDSVSDDAYVPIFDISRDPDGTHSDFHEDLNLLTPWFEEDFLGQANVKDYHLTFDNLDEVEPIVEVMDSNGEFQEKIYGSEYTVNYETGVITFVVAPGESPSEGHDNVKIRACKTFEGYQDRINKCTVGALYGVNGSLDSLFLSGNPDYLNYDWHSKANEPTYFKDTAYATLGSSSSAIVGYSIINNYLAAHKDRYERDQNIILREGDLVDNQPAFRIINTLQGAGAVAPFSFAYLATEPLFLTEQGIYAVTAQDITGEKYAQDRSFFLNGRLLQEENLKDAYAITYNDMYLLCINDVVYILDGLQPIRTDRAEPYATRQYAGFYRTNVPARVMWEDGGRLFFGTDDGKVCRFFNDKYSNESYNDNGEVIEANWETPDIIGKVFFKNKTLRHIAIKLDSSISTSVNIYVMNRGLYNFVKTEGRLRELWDFVGTDNTRARFLSFANLIFSRFTFSNDQTQHTLPTKVRVKKVDKFRLKLTNDQLNEPFGLFDIGFEYVESGNYKG